MNYINCELVKAENVPPGQQYGYAVSHEDGTRSHADEIGDLGFSEDGG